MLEFELSSSRFGIPSPQIPSALNFSKAVYWLTEMKGYYVTVKSEPKRIISEAKYPYADPVPYSTLWIISRLTSQLRSFSGQEYFMKFTQLSQS